MMPRFMRALARSGAAAAILIGWCAAEAQSSHFSDATVSTISARALVNEPPGTQFVLGKPILLTLRPTDAARQFAQGGFQVRLFPLGEDATMPQEWAMFDPCAVFLSLLLPHARSSANRIDLGRTGGLRWLTLVDGQAPKTGRYIVVFQKGTDSHDLLRLNDQDRDRYFSRGLYIEVVPDRAYAAGEVAAAAKQNDDDTRDILAAASRNAKDLQCYRVATTDADPNGIKLAAGNCETGPAPRAP